MGGFVSAWGEKLHSHVISSGWKRSSAGWMKQWGRSLNMCTHCVLFHTTDREEHRDTPSSIPHIHNMPWCQPPSLFLFSMIFLSPCFLPSLFPLWSNLTSLTYPFFKLSLSFLPYLNVSIPWKFLSILYLNLSYFHSCTSFLLILFLISFHPFSPFISSLNLPFLHSFINLSNLP